MNKILISALLALGMVGCSTETMPQAQTIIVADNCSDLQDLVRSNQQQIRQALTNNDANTVGALELLNRDIFKSSRYCFPDMNKNMCKKPAN